MKLNKVILSIALGLGLMTNAKAVTFTLVSQPGTMTNLLSVYNGSAKITQVIVSTATAVTNVSNLQFIDSITNTLSNVSTTPYTNTFEYATNLVTLYTNYWGNINQFTNLATVVATNSYPGFTNAWPVRLIGTATTNNPTIYSGVNYYFGNGVWVTNGGSGPANITITYQQ